MIEALEHDYPAPDMSPKDYANPDGVARYFEARGQWLLVRRLRILLNRKEKPHGI